MLRNPTPERVDTVRPGDDKTLRYITTYSSSFGSPNGNANHYQSRRPNNNGTVRFQDTEVQTKSAWESSNQGAENQAKPVTTVIVTRGGKMTGDVSRDSRSMSLDPPSVRPTGGAGYTQVPLKRMPRDLEALTNNTSFSHRRLIHPPIASIDEGLGGGQVWHHRTVRFGAAVDSTVQQQRPLAQINVATTNGINAPIKTTTAVAEVKRDHNSSATLANEADKQARNQSEDGIRPGEYISTLQRTLIPPSSQSISANKSTLETSGLKSTKLDEPRWSSQNTQQAPPSTTTTIVPYQNFSRNDFSRMFSQIARITDHLLLSSLSALTPERLEQHGVTLLVTAMIDPAPAALRTAVTNTLHVSVEDTELGNLKIHFDRVADRIASERRRGGRALVHCAAGVSRSSSLVLAYLVRHLDLSLADAYQRVKSIRPCIQPNAGFWRQLLEYEERIRGSRSVRLLAPLGSTSILSPTSSSAANTSTPLPSSASSSFYSRRPLASNSRSIGRPPGAVSSLVNNGSNGSGDYYSHSLPTTTYTSKLHHFNHRQSPVTSTAFQPSYGYPNSINNNRR